MAVILSSGLLIKSIRLLYIFGLSTGLSPYMINQKGELYINKQSILQVILPLLINMLILLFSYYMDCGNALCTTGLLKLVYDVRNYFWFIVNVIIIILEFFNRNKFVVILQQLQGHDNIGEKYSAIFKQISYKNLRALLVKAYLFIWFVILAIICVDVIVLKRIGWQYLCFISYFTTYLVLPFMLLKICVINYLLTERFSDINYYLESSRAFRLKVS